MRGTDPITTPLSRKSTDPDGTPEPGARGLTIAVKMTAWALRDGFTEDVRVVVVLAALTVCTTAGEELAEKPPLPEYCADSA